MSAFDLLSTRGVSRLCHFTKLNKLTHIIQYTEGVLASSSIRSDIKDVTDTARYDGELDYVCCSIEYPNSWFMQKAIQNNTDQVFNEWVVLFIDLDILNLKNAKFCPCNSSKGRGAYIDNHMENVDSIFAQKISTFQHQRKQRMLSCCPTDGQAEILIRNNIPRDYIIGIAVGNADVGKRVYAMLKTLKIKQIPIYIAPDVLKTTWSNMIQQGKRPDEILCVWPEED